MAGSPAPDHSAWIPVIGALGGALIGGMIGFLTSTRLASLNDRRNRRDLLIAKFEEIHAALGAVRKRNLSLFLWLKDRSEPGEIPKELEDTEHHGRVSTLIEIYAPQLRSALYELMKRDMAWMRVFNEAKRGLPRTKIDQAKLSESEGATDLEHAKLQRDVAHLAQKLVGQKVPHEVAESAATR